MAKTKFVKASNEMEQYIDNAPFGLLYVKNNGNIIGLNETLKKWIGASKEQILGKSISAISDITPSNVTDFIAHVHRSVPTRLKPNKIDQIRVLLFSTKISDDYNVLTLFKQDFELIHFENPLETLPLPSLIISGTDGYIQNANNLCKKKYRIKIGDIFTNYLEEQSLHQLSNVFKTEMASLELNFNNVSTNAMSYIKQLKKDEFLIQLIDKSEQKKLEQQFIQSQKTQAIGQLAGGIAHDFNNLLTAIIGFCDMLLQRIMPNDPSYSDIMHIKQNANRASNLVKQLLAFSRRQSLQPRKINIADALADLSALLRRLIGSKINFKLVQCRNLWPVKVDVIQFEQVIINLVVNARDAMENGGALTIESSNYTVTNSCEDIIAGDYVLIKVIDTGCGISQELIKSIFEPFFSTKSVGQGTGLGLATAYGIVKQTGGTITVSSKVKEGSSFSVFLPRCNDKENIVTLPEKKLVQDVTGTETILLVEDDDAVRLFASKALRDKGYRVIDASDGIMALNIIKAGTKPNILITDVSMPEIDGQTLAKKITELIPNLPIIFMSGYAEETFRRDLSENQSMHFLPKPFTLRDLAPKIREILD
jgi:two-component system cell cycle sensor histidine kinase/response regulator CckA